MKRESSFEHKLRRATAIAPTIKRQLQNDGSLSPQDIAELSAKLKVPGARIRAIHSFFDDLHSPPHATRICHGTSCQLAGASYPQLDAEAGTRGVYCLGRCYRAPNALTADERVLEDDPDDPTKHCYVNAATSRRCPVYCLAAYPVVSRRILNGDYSDLNQARQAGVYLALKHALEMPANRVIEMIGEAELRGRGGAGFPVAQKWTACAATAATNRVVVVNGDEGDPGSFVDRVLMESDPHALLEGLTICAYAVGASHALVYVRSEYPLARHRMQTAIEQAYAQGILGPSVLGSPFALHVQVVSGMGSYVCGEETAMLNAIEGRRGEVRLRPPYPTSKGLLGFPTVVNNVETMVVVPQIIELGADRYKSLGSEHSKGTKIMCLNHGFKRPGLYEVEFGTRLDDLFEAAGGATGERPLEAVILGGPMGSIVPADQFDVEIGFESMQARGFQLGHGGVVALLAGTDYRALLRHCIRFMAHESCGKCLPCSLGSKQLDDMLHDSKWTASSPAEFRQQLALITETSLCAFGQLIPQAVASLLDVFADQMLEEEP